MHLMSWVVLRRRFRLLRDGRRRVVVVLRRDCMVAAGRIDCIVVAVVVVVDLGRQTVVVDMAVEDTAVDLVVVAVAVVVAYQLAVEEELHMVLLVYYPLEEIEVDCSVVAASAEAKIAAE